ncbi:uncharacterized protein LOC142231945 [Haematobia irritans]|uniref:uncharacterized protein LOC142231945 n=1 Tax=Haematobia irritans TaxID=7368 RepID=UPI003F501954
MPKRTVRSSLVKTKINCLKCKKVIKEETQNYIKCDKCEKTFHLSCTDLTKREFEMLIDNESETFECEYCREEEDDDSEREKEISLNSRSVSSINKFNRLKGLLSSIPILPDIIAIQETWFQNAITQIYSIPGYKVVHCCREDGYGGTSVYVRDKWVYTVDYCKSESFLDIIAISLLNFKVNARPMKFLTFYRSQKCSVEQFKFTLESMLNDHAGSPIVLVGDTNIDRYHSSYYNEMLDLFQSFGCENAHEMVTRPLSNTCIDHVFSNFVERVDVDSVECDISDHNLVFCKIKSKIMRNDFVEVMKTKCDYQKAKRYLSDELSPDFGSLNVQDQTDRLTSCIQGAIAYSTTVSKTLKHARFMMTPWINVNLQHLITIKFKLLKRRKKERGNEAIQDSLKRISRIISIANKRSREAYYAENIDRAANDPKRGWNFINEVLGKKGHKELELKDVQGRRISNNLDKANALNTYFLDSVMSLRRGILVDPGDNINIFHTLSGDIDSVFSIEQVDNNCIMEVIENLKAGKSPGHDGISSIFLKECSEIVSPFLAKIFNGMISLSIYPDILKLHRIVPIPKIVNASDVSNFRPVAVLSTIDKIFEKIIYDKLYTYCESNNLLYENQYGFRRGCGTEEAVLNVIKFICSGLDGGFNGVAGVFFDFSKAFDLVDHQLLLEKMHIYGIRGKEFLLFRSFLENRKQYVDVSKSKSFVGPVVHGVPQGSCLGPLLFSIFINDIRNLQLSGKLFMFADDICLFYPYKYDIALRANIERDSALLCEFARVNRLVLNADKTKLIRFRPNPSVNNDFSVYIDGKSIHECISVTYLGVMLQNNLAWDCHIRSLKRKIAPAIGFLYKMKNKLNTKTKLTIFSCLIQSHLNYMVTSYAYNKNNSELRSLQSMQNKALKVVFNLPPNFSTLSLFEDMFSSVITTLVTIQ